MSKKLDLTLNPIHYRVKTKCLSILESEEQQISFFYSLQGGD